MHLTRISQETNKQKRKIRERNMLLADEGAPKLMGHPLFMHAMTITLLPQVSGGWRATFRGYISIPFFNG